MVHSIRRFLVLGLVLTFAVAAAAQSAPLSDRVVAYKIDAKYDARTHSLDGEETLTYTNHTGQALTHFPFHLYLNAFQPNSTWVREAHQMGSRDFGPNSGWESKHNGSNTVARLEVVGMGDLTSKMQFIAPDDGNKDDKTVMDVQLPRPVAPNEQVTFKISFHAQFPEVVARTGYKRDFILAGQWFPKVGVFWNGNWNCHQFHANSEFFADFGTYDVNVTIPKNFNFGSVGVVSTKKDNGDGTTTYSAHAEDVHDFAWTADPTTKLTEDNVTLSTGPVHIRVLMQPGHESSTARYIQALKGTMQKFDEWYGPYPYPQITVVDPPSGGAAAGGMEYPMFITGDTSWIMPSSIKLAEDVIEHEYGHQYWYGMVATNEFEDAWLDEGINSYTEAKIMDALYGRDSSVLNSHLGVLSSGAFQRLEYLPVASYDPLTPNAWQYVNGNSYGGITYGKTATVMLSLERLVGEDKVREAVHSYFMKYRFKHPTEQDFLNSMNESIGQNLDWFWDQAVKGTQELDFEVMKVQSGRADWYRSFKDSKKDKSKDSQTIYDSEVTIHRKGDFIMPVSVLVKFEDGTSLTEQWDGRDRWHRFSYSRPSKVESAQLYGGGNMPLDSNFLNDRWTSSEDRRGASKFGMYWTWAVQLVAQLLTYLT